MLEINQVHCINCIDALKQIPDDYVDLIFVDPPYGGILRQEWDTIDALGKDVVEHSYRVLKPTGSIYVWCSVGEKSDSLIRFYQSLKKKFHIKDVIVWKKQRGRGNRRGWLFVREEIIWAVKDNNKFIWNTKFQYSSETYDPAWVKRLNRESNPFKRLTNVWTDIKENSLSGACGIRGLGKKTDHPTSKPEAAIERVISSHTSPGDLVLDYYAGTCSLAKVCSRMGRNFICVDNNPVYCDIARKELNAPL